MPVAGPEVTDIHSFENILLVADERFHRIVEPDDAVLPLIVEHSPAIQFLRHLKTESVVPRAGVQLEQIMLHASHTAVNTHVVVVENDEQIIGSGRSVVQSLKSQTTAHGAIPDYGNDIAVGLSFFLKGNRHSQGSRNGIGSMAAGKAVVLALFGRRERTDAMQFPVGRKTFSSAGQNLVPVCLMPHVPHNTVVRRIENIMKRHGQFNDPQTRSKVPRIVDNVLTQLGTNLWQLLHGKLSQVGR